MEIHVHDNNGIETHRLSAEDITPQVERKLKALYAFGGFCKIGSKTYPDVDSLIAASLPAVAS